MFTVMNLGCQDLKREVLEIDEIIDFFQHGPGYGNTMHGVGNDSPLVFIVEIAWIAVCNGCGNVHGVTWEDIRVVWF
jgi:hypothetical protein